MVKKNSLSSSYARPRNDFLNKSPLDGAKRPLNSSSTPGDPKKKKRKTSLRLERVAPFPYSPTNSRNENIRPLLRDQKMSPPTSRASRATLIPVADVSTQPPGKLFCAAHLPHFNSPLYRPSEFRKHLLHQFCLAVYIFSRWFQ